MFLLKPHPRFSVFTISASFFFFLLFLLVVVLVVVLRVLFLFVCSYCFVL